MSPPPTSVRLSPEMLQELGKLAEKLDRPVAWLIRQAVKEYLERQNEAR